MSRAPLLRKWQASLQCLLGKIDLLKFSLDLLKHRVWSKEACDKFSTLDPDPNHLEPEVKVRYLLQHVYERVREDDNVYDRLITVFHRHGVKVRALYEVMGREIENVEENAATGGEIEDIELVEQDVAGLVEVLVSGSYLWDAIGIALNLPKHKREDCGEGKDNVNRLINILTTWILGSYEGARPATLTSLREALSSKTVGLGRLALELMTYKGFVDSLPVIKKPRINLDMSYQSCDTEVAESKSTLLEVQVNSTGCESYQWSKDGKPLLEGSDFCGVYNNILYINKANQSTEGRYSCCVNRGCETKYSDEMILSVLYPLEKKQLLEFYSLTETEVPQDSWPPVGNSTFINLVLIRQKLMSTCDYYTVRGDMDDILESKEVAEYEQVFREYKEGALFLLEGRPGSGKTTLVHKLTRDWSAGKKILVGAKMVFLITLRLLNASGRDNSLLDLLQIFYGEGVKNDIEYGLKNCRGKEACFILDGLDEYPIESRKKLIVDQLLFSKTFLPCSMVIVASRPVATKVLRTMCKTRIEVVGFSRNQIHSYVRAYPFSDCSVNMTCKMQDFLDQHPNVLHMCYLPIHASMICFLFSQLEGNVPHRETQCYEQFTIATLLKHKARKGEEPQLRSLENLSGEEKEFFNSVCKLAFDMIINSQQVVSKSDAQVSLLSVLELLTIERTCKYYGNEDFYSFSHLTFQEYLAAFHIREAHLEEDELIAKDSLKNVWRYYSGLVRSNANITFVKTIFDTSCFDFLYKVQCAYESQQVELCDYLIEDEAVSISETAGYIITSIDFIALGYVISNATKLVRKIVLEECKWDTEGVELFVSQTSDIRLQFIKDLKIFIKNDQEIRALNFLLVHLSFLERLDILDVELGKFKIDCLTNGIRLPHLKILKISLPLIFCSHPHEVLRRLAFGNESLNHVYYSVHRNATINHVVWNKILHCAFSCEMSNMSWLHLCNIEKCHSFPRERLSHSIEVVLVNCCLSDEEVETLVDRLNTSILEKLVLDFNRISDLGAVSLASCLARCSVVKEVSIQCNSIGDSGATALADALAHCGSLKKLDLQGNSLEDKGAIAVAKATESVPCLDLYLHNVNISEKGIERVLEHRAETRIRNMEFTSSWESVSEADIDNLKRALYCGSLPALRLSTSNISNLETLVTEQEYLMNVRGIECEYTILSSPIVLSIMNCLPTLYILDCGFNDDISSTSAQHLSECMKTCKSLHSLTLRGRFGIKLHNCLLGAIGYLSQLQSLSLFFGDIRSFGVNLFFGNDEFWNNLHTLELRYSSIGSDGAHVLSKIVRHCKKLQHLDLSTNISCTGIGDNGTIALAEGLKDHNNLLQLDLGYNGITLEGVAALSQVIKCNHLQSLGLSDNRLGSECVSVLVDVLDVSTLRTLNLSRNELGVDGIASLSVGLKNCTQLARLDIHANDIGSNGVAYLAKGLKYCPNIQELDLCENNIDSDGVTALCSIMESCAYLKILVLSSNAIGVDGASGLVGGWQHMNVLKLFLYYCFSEPHESALESGGSCCNICEHLLQYYYGNDYVYIPHIPKLVSPEC